MTLTIEAIYENGVLKPAQPLPLKEQERVQVTVHTANNWVTETAGMIKWTGDHEYAPAPGRRCRVRSPGAGMTFADLIAGEAIFLDANYSFTTSSRIRGTARLAANCSSASKTRKSRA